ncbi:hypothetical protein D3C73_828210 [compost metagenome]
MKLEVFSVVSTSRSKIKAATLANCARFMLSLRPNVVSVTPSKIPFSISASNFAFVAASRSLRSVKSADVLPNATEENTDNAIAVDRITDKLFFITFFSPP